MRSKHFLVALLLLVVTACASGGLAGSPATRTADTMADAVTTYKALEPRLNANQREEFRDAYDHVASAYQTAGVLLGAIVDAEDEASSRTSLNAYLRTTAAIPDLADKVWKLVQKFKGATKK